MYTKEKIKLTLKQRLAKLMNYFLRGLLVVLPFAVTYSILKWVMVSLDTFVDVGVPAAGFVIVVISITFLGYIGSNILARPLLSLMDDILSRIPFVKIIYTSVKDFMEAFVGDKKKFNHPVLIQMNEGVYKPGFITQEDLSTLNLPGLVAVYCPHSYALSGVIYIVEKDKIKPFDGNVTEVMKFILSGGVTNID